MHFLWSCLQRSIYRFEAWFHAFKILSIVRCFSVFSELSLDLLYVWLYTFPDEWEIDECRKNPTDESDNDSCSYERTKSTSNSSNKVRPEHFPWRFDIFGEFLESCSLYCIDESLYLTSFFRPETFDFGTPFSGEFFDLFFFLIACFHMVLRYSVTDSMQIAANGKVNYLQK